jgi:exopolysaccharide biosynthesis polyprenyl glycosylphosphotransferase
MNATSQPVPAAVHSALGRATRIPSRGWLVRRALAFADMLGLAVAFVLTEVVFGRTGDGSAAAPQEFLLVLTLPLWVVLAKLYGLYDQDEERAGHTTVDDLVGVFHLVTVGVWLVFVAISLTEVASPAFEKLVIFWALAIVLVVGGRSAARVACKRHPAYIQRSVIVGAGDVGQLVAQKILGHPEYGLELLGFVDERPKPRSGEVEALALLGTPADLPDLVLERGIERVIIAFTGDRHDETLDLIRALGQHEVQVDIVPRMFEIVGARAGLHSVEGMMLIGLSPLRLSRSSRVLKRAMDVALAGTGLLLLSPVLAAIAAWIRLDSPGPALFSQERIGAGDRVFRILKFRTMEVGADERKGELAHMNMHLARDPRMFKITDDPRVTRAGRVLRRFKLDELPQLVNVLRGDMSLVGPRPLVHDEDRWVSDWARRRLELRPGVTGLWQVLGASDIPFEEMTKLDYLYVTNWTLWGDLRIVLHTIPALLRARNAY